MKFATTKEFIKQNYYKHLLYSLVLTIPSIWFMYEYMHLRDTGFGFTIFVGTFGARAVNWVREWTNGIIYKAPWSWGRY